MNAKQLREINDLNHLYKEAREKAGYFTKNTFGDEKIVRSVTIDFGGKVVLDIPDDPKLKAELHDAVAGIFARYEKRLLRKLRAAGFDPESPEESPPPETPKKVKHRPEQGTRALEV